MNTEVKRNERYMFHEDRWLLCPHLCKGESRRERFDEAEGDEKVEE